MNSYIFKKMFLKLLHGKKCIVDQSTLLYNFIVKLNNLKIISKYMLDTINSN